MKRFRKLVKNLPTKKIIASLALVLIIGLSPLVISQIRVWQARAAVTIFWDGGGDGTSWSDGLNWNTDTIPVATDEVLIDTTSTVNITAPITIKALTLGRVDGTTSSTLNFAYDAVSIDPLTISDYDLIIYPATKITHTAGSGATIVGRININVQTGDLKIYGSINADEKGYGAGTGPGTGVSGTLGAGGAGHGGIGGNGKTRAGGPSYGSYLQPYNPGSGGGTYSTGAGAGGGVVKLTVADEIIINGPITAKGGYGNASDNVNVSGGGSGGSIWINANSVTGTSNINVDGGTTKNDDHDGGGGAGGRIALYYTTNGLTNEQISSMGGNPLGADTAVQKGGAGTIYLKAAAATNGDLVIDNKDTAWETSKDKVAKTPLDNSLSFENVTITNYSNIAYSSTINATTSFTVDNISHFDLNGTLNTAALSVNGDAWLYNQASTTITYSSIDWTGGNIIDNGGTFALVSGGGALTIPDQSTLYGNTARTFTSVIVNGVLSHTENASTEVNKLNYTTSGDFTVNVSGSVNVNDKGYAETYGLGTGVSGSAGAGGAGYGGIGGNGKTRAGGPSYGSYTSPYSLGSGGGSYSTGGGGAGGGVVKLTVGGTITVNGPITSKGGNGINSNDGAGGGSGGSIWINANTIAGNSYINSDGGGAQNSTHDGGGGAGGRIALYYTSSSLTTSQISAMGGQPDGLDTAVQKGGAGTIYLKAAAATNGDLIISNGNTLWNTSRDKVAKTPLATSITIDNFTADNYANVDDGTTLTVVSDLLVNNYSYFDVAGSVGTNTLTINGDSWYLSQASASTTYSSLDWANSNFVDNGGTFALVSGVGALTIPDQSTLYGNTARTFTSVIVNGILSHTENSTDEIYEINYTVSGNFELTASGTINLNERGYADGYGPGVGVSGSDGAGGGAYGGDGGDGQTRAGGTPYGDQLAPDRIGSGGGQYNNLGGHGGGAVKIDATGTAIINGTISSNGGYGAIYNNYHGNGGGSGGSIWILADTLTGTGALTAIGGDAGNDDRDGGGGSGGRIALYFASNTSSFSQLSVAGGTALGASAQSGAVGTIFLGGKSADPINLRQYKADGVTAIGQGQATNEGSIITTFQVQDSNTSATLTPEVEIQTLGTAFTNVATNTGTPVVYSGTILTASVDVTGLADGGEYHWQSRVCDETLICSNWVSFGNNLETEADVRVVMNTSPNTPVIPTSSSFIDAQYTNNLQPTLGFVLSDPNSIDSVGYQIQVDSDAGFASPIIDYTSDMGAQGTQSFVVGQAEGTGVYTAGAESQELITGDYYWRVKAIDDKAGQSGWTVAPGTPSFKIDLSLPSNATDVRMKANAAAVNEYTGTDTNIWFSRDDLYFSWDAGTDAQGVKGYCMYLGLSSDGNPAIEKGLLGSSPISTTGTTCEFITDQITIDFANTALQSYDWLTSNPGKYYLKVKTIDQAGNIFNGADDTNFITFYFDNTAPENVTAISAASGTFSSTADMYFTWPVSLEHGAGDTHSGVLGFQYALNSRDTWFGDHTDGNTGQVYSLMGREQPFFLPPAVGSLVQLGQNILYFRIIDVAGNYSELRTAYMNYGGEAPKFDPGDVVTVTPSINTINNFGFSWPAAHPSDGNTLASYYYMINTSPPVSFSTITSNSATYKPTTLTAVAAGSIPGLRKGTNDIYVVAVDNSGNYSSSNSVTATFTLDTELPDPPSDMTIADSSIKDASIWRAALVWGFPEYAGTGDLTYHIQRSENGVDWSPIASTTGLSYVDTVPESKQYFWRVGTTDNSDESIASPSYSSAVSIIPRGRYTAPATLTSGPAASSISTTKATITWTTNRNSDSKIAFGLGSGNYFDWEPSVSGQVTEHTINLSNLEPGTTYYYKAKWTDEDGNTGESEEETFTTEPPPSVKDVRVSSIGISSVIITFTTQKANGAKLYYGTSTSFGGIKEIGTSKVESTYSIQLDNLQDGTKYYYQINAFDEEEKEYLGTILDFETLPRPRVLNVKVQQVAKTAQSTVLVTWESNTAISSVVTFYPQNNPDLVKDNVDINLEDGEHQMLLKGLFPDTSYVISVSGKDIVGNEAVSDTLLFVTSSDTRAPQISELIVESSNTSQSGSTISQLIVSWTTDEPSMSQVEFGEGSGSNYNQLTQEDKDFSSEHVVIISGLSPSKVYHLRAISTDGSGNISRSVDTVTITPKATDSAWYLVITTLEEAFGFLNEL